MDKEEQLISDFKEWNGGSDPDECSQVEIDLYLETSLSSDFDPESAKVILYAAAGLN